MTFSLPLVAGSFIVFLIFAYNFYGRWVARQFQLDDSRVTPAHHKNDGVDFVPTPRFYLFAQHFSAIAAAGPIAGPIVACQSFGWLPCLLWISLGVVLIGAVHDLSGLVISVRHGACSIAEVTKEHLGPMPGKALMLFIWISLIYIIVAFTDITASSFVSAIEELQGVGTALNFNPGGAVAAASIFYLTLSVILGFVQRYLNPPLWLVTLIFVPAAFLCSWMGTYFSTVFVFDTKIWALMIILYCGLASMLPVWALLQPRGYLGGFILYAAIGVGIMGIFFGGYEIQQPAFVGFGQLGTSQSLFPFLFVTIACGACSGFHGLVCSGTTSKQVDKESHMLAVGHGAMLAEGLVAVIALMIVMIMTPESIKGMKPGTIYGHGIGQFLTLILGKEKLSLAITFGAMAFSTFVFDTLDVATRLGRYLVQELLGMKAGVVGAIIGTVATLLIPAIILITADEGMWSKFWTLFGSANQLLAALTLLTVTLLLVKSKRKMLFTLLPMVFVLTVTLWSLGQLVWINWQSSQGWDTFRFNAFFALLLILLALYLVVTAVREIFVRRFLGKT